MQLFFHNPIADRAVMAVTDRVRGLIHPLWIRLVR